MDEQTDRALSLYEKEINDLRAELARHQAEFREQIQAEHAAYQEVHRDNERLRAALNIEHETQRQMLERLDIEWTPGEPFYALVEDEIVRQRAALNEIMAMSEPAGYGERSKAQIRDVARRALGSDG